MGFKTARAALSSPTFAAQAFITILINCLVNLGLPYATYSNWGSRDHAEQFPSLYMWRWNYEVQSCIALDVFLTHFLLGAFCTWAGSGGAQKDVRERKCPTLEPAALARRPWVLTPVNVRSIFWRGLAIGVYTCVVAGIPLGLLVWLFVQNGTWQGYSYVWVKGIYAGVVLAPAVYTLVFLSAIDRRNFPELEYAMLGVGGEPSGGGADMPGGRFPDVVLDGADKVGYYGAGGGGGGVGGASPSLTGPQRSVSLTGSTV